MAEAQYNWPAREAAQVIGKRHRRLDGMVKVTGAARYTYDVQLKNQLVVRALSSPHAHCRIKAIDVSQAKAVPGVVAVKVLPHAEPGKEIRWEGELLVAVAAESTGAATEGVSKIKLGYEPLDVFTQDNSIAAAEEAERTSRTRTRVETEREPGDDDDEDEFVEQEIQRLFGEAKYVVEGQYGIEAITHCCMEPHGATVHWEGDRLKVYLSTQNVSGTDDQIAAALKQAGMDISADQVDVDCQYLGGGFGSKFSADYWTIAAAQIAKETGRPVKFMLDRAQELKIAGNRPSGFIQVKLGADADGMVTVWDSTHCGTSGPQGGGVSLNSVPYVFSPKNWRARLTPIKTNLAPSRAWRAPSNPQACLLTMPAFDDLAAKMGADSYDIFYKNLEHIKSPQPASVYRRQMAVAARLMDWKAKWHPHGKGQPKGSIVDGLGMALHMWNTPGHTSECRVRIHPDGSVQSYCGTQDLGTGTRTICAMVVAETMGLPVNKVRANIGSSTYPASGPSGGSQTVGGVSESHRRASQDALRILLAKVAPRLDAKPDQLEAVNGRIQVKGTPARSISWKEACGTLGLQPLEAVAKYQTGSESPLSNRGVAGVQMAHVQVDRETGVVRMKKFVAVQDMGLVVNRQTAEHQMYGGITMGIAYALYEQRITDPKTGAWLNADLANYRLPRLGDIGDIVVHLFEPDDQRQRGVVGLGEPPVISPGAAISNAVCNALGVRVGGMPITPKRVIDTLENTAGRA